MSFKVKYKVLRNDLISPYLTHQYELGKWYHEPNLSEMGESGCCQGLYATDVEGLLYRGVWREDEAVFRCEVKGREAGEAFKICYEYLRIVEKVSEEEVRKLARAEHDRLGYLLEEGLYPINPLVGKPKKPTDEDLELLKQWVNIWRSVGDSVWGSVGDSVRDSVWGNVRDSVWNSVWNSVWAYMGSLFPNIEKWKHIDHKPGEYPFKCGSDLWRRGFVPSFDGVVWRLHSGKKAKVVWESKRGRVKIALKNCWS